MKHYTAEESFDVWLGTKDGLKEFYCEATVEQNYEYVSDDNAHPDDPHPPQVLSPVGDWTIIDFKLDGQEHTASEFVKVMRLLGIGEDEIDKFYDAVEDALQRS